jgi:hypothetical protein
MKDYLAHAEKLRQEAAECARDLATDKAKCEMFDRLVGHLTVLADKVEMAILERKKSTSEVALIAVPLIRWAADPGSERNKQRARFCPRAVTELTITARPSASIGDENAGCAPALWIGSSAMQRRFRARLTAAINDAAIPIAIGFSAVSVALLSLALFAD